MKNIKIYFLLIAVLAVGAFSCEGEEENFDWQTGPELLIYTPNGHGDTELEVGTEHTFSVAGFDTRMEYRWTVAGPGASVTSGTGEFLDVTFNEPGTYTITVSNPQDEGNVSIVAVE